MTIESQMARSWTKTGFAWSFLYAINLPTLFFSFLIEVEERHWGVMGMIAAWALLWLLGPLMLYLSKSGFEALSEGLIATAGMQLIPVLQYSACWFAIYTVDQHIAISDAYWHQQVRSFLIITNSTGIIFMLAWLIGLGMKALRGANNKPPSRLFQKPC